MKPRILVVDDEESIREFLDIMLKKEWLYSDPCKRWSRGFGNHNEEVL